MRPPRIHRFATLTLAFATSLLIVLMATPSTSTAQPLTITEPAAGSTVKSTFSVRVNGPASARVMVLIDGEEFASISLDGDGKGQARLAAPDSESFRLELQQLDGGDVIASTSIRLKHSPAEVGEVPPPPPTPGGEPTKDTSASQSEKPANDAKIVDPTTDELPPPPPPPDDTGSATSSDTPPTPTTPTEEDAVAPPPPVDEVDQVDRAEDVDSAEPPRLSTGQVNQPIRPPSAGKRVLRIVIQGLAAFFAVPTAWVIGAVGVGIFTGFDNDVERQIAWSFAFSGVAASTASVWLAGDYLDGNGSFLATLVGATVTTGLTMLFIMADTTEDGLTDDDALFIGAAMGSMVGIGGAIAGYELTSDTDANYSNQTGTSDAILGVGPTPDGRGFMLGVGGRF